MPSPDDFVRRAFEAGASDLILAEGQAPSVRIHGEIVPLEPTPLDRVIIAELWTACGADPEHIQEIDLSRTSADGSRLRVNLFKSLGKLSAVLRPIKRRVPDFQELGLPAELLAGWLGHRSGLILVSGPAGSGKSTTIASCLDWINRHYRRHIVTIEDPIEYLFENDLSHFSQREIGQDTATFAGALRVALRQSPDIIFLGEIRDEDSALIALRAAETGHLVLATLHSSGVPETLDRLGNFYQPSQRDAALQLLGDHLVGVLSQRLLPATSGGLFLAVEHLENEAATRQWIRERNQTALRDFLNRSAAPGSVPFLHSLREAVMDGHVHPSTARAAAPNAHDFDRALRGIS